MVVCSILQGMTDSAKILRRKLIDENILKEAFAQTNPVNTDESIGSGANYQLILVGW